MHVPVLLSLYAQHSTKRWKDCHSGPRKQVTIGWGKGELLQCLWQCEPVLADVAIPGGPASHNQRESSVLIHRGQT